MLCRSEVPVPAVGTKEDITTTTVIHYVEYDNPKYYGEILFQILKIVSWLSLGRWRRSFFVICFTSLVIQASLDLWQYWSSIFFRTLSLQGMCKCRKWFGLRGYSNLIFIKLTNIIVIIVRSRIFYRDRKIHGKLQRNWRPVL